MIDAHSRNADGNRHLLDVHLRAVANLAAAFAAPFGGSDLARWVGLAHDVGKASDQFQAYLAACEQAPAKRRPTTDHKGAGTLLAFDGFDCLAFLIQGHHGGLPDKGTLLTKHKELRTDASVAATIDRARQLALLPPAPEALDYPTFVHDERSEEFFLRRLFSALVDADHLDTERHFEPDQAAERGASPDLATLAARLEADQARLTGRRDDAVGRMRDEVYQACLAAAANPPGFFRLTVPTGGGKTRSGLAFALRHALAHGLERVIVAVPYLPITDQTAQVYRDALGGDRAVLEHHSGAALRRRNDAEGRLDDDGSEATAERWRRLATQELHPSFGPGGD